MKTVTSHSVQTKFEQFSDLVKSREPVVITQYNRPTMLVLSYDDGMEMVRLAAKMRFLQLMDERAKECDEPTEEEMAELSRIIKEEREAVYQERLKNAQ